MKRIIFYVALITFLGTQGAKAQKKEFKEEIKKELSFENKGADNTLIVQNVNGSINVEGYDGERIQLSVEKSIWAKNTKDLELGKQEIGVKVLQQGNEIVIHADVPNMHFKNGHLTSIDCNNNEQLSYEYNLNFTVRIPNNIKLEVGTINNGEVSISNMRGSYIKANNINGGIALENVTGQTEVHCINGAVGISYADNPTEPSTYYSLNGDINIEYQKNLSADISFKSMNGELFTDFDIAKQYAKTSKNESRKRKGIKYKYEAKPVVQIGKGGLSHDFETLNGNVIIKKI